MEMSLSDQRRSASAWLADGTAPRIRVLDSFTTDAGTLSWGPVEALGDVKIWPRTAPEEVEERIRDAHVILTNKVPMDEATMNLAPSLSYVGKLATGYNDVDLNAAKDRGIAVTNVPAYSTMSVVQLVFAFMLQHCVDVTSHAESVRRGEWASSADFCYTLRPVPEINKKTLVIVGTGSIGSAVKTVAEAFNMRVVSAQVPGRPASADRVSLDEALPQADFITLHCPLTAATNMLVSDDFLSRCKQGAVLINTGRGALLDEAAAVKALDSGRLGGVYVDVLAKEPPRDGASAELIKHPKATVTPHIGWMSVEARTQLITEVAQNVQAFIKGDKRNRIV